MPPTWCGRKARLRQITFVISEQAASKEPFRHSRRRFRSLPTLHTARIVDSASARVKNPTNDDTGAGRLRYRVWSIYSAEA